MTVEARRHQDNHPAGRPLPAADEAARNFWLLCRVGTRLCAMPVEGVVEIMRLQPIETVSGAPPYVRGLCIIRGAPVPVVDAGLLLGDRAVEGERLVTVRAGSRTVALAVEAVLGIREIATEALGELPPLVRETATEAVVAIGTADAELLFFLRTARIVPQEWLDRPAADGAAA